MAIIPPRGSVEGKRRTGGIDETRPQHDPASITGRRAITAVATIIGNIRTALGYQAF
ncbi:hypothetical protein ACFPVT_09765 [Corynebacterium choanae]|uniref:hypothetical protein n=1 Tax=Corynebacterium choanae TaxID=1862358 RepID=UPI0013DE5024|nr:hypothetical protein [Corynebacterium choanae]